MKQLHGLAVAAFSLAAVSVGPALADPFAFSTGTPDGRIATGSRPSSTGKVEIESADDFILGTATRLNSATFTGLLTGGATVGNITGVTVEIYRVFPFDSTNPPSGNVPTRVNSPSDVAFISRDSTAGELSFSTNSLNASFTAANSVLNGINKIPNQKTGGEGSVSGAEVEFDVTFATPLTLPADHYFFIPQVQLANGDFLWLSTAKPIVAPGTAFTGDLQSWVRNGPLDPDWLRIGTDIVGGSNGAAAPTFNAAFSLNGITVPEPASALLLGAGLLGLALRRRRCAARTPAA